MAEVLTWVDADGVEHPLTAAYGVRVLKGMSGRFMPPVSLVEEEIPFQPGAHLRHTKAAVREVAIPLLFQAANESALRLALRAWLTALNIDRGPGTLRVLSPDGSSRELINAIYAGGMEIIEAESTRGPTWQKAVVVFRAHDPYWYDQDATLHTFVTAAPVAFFPMFPLSLSASELSAPVSVLNDGDSDSWPTWRINGPGVDPILTNVTTGKDLRITHTLLAGEYIDIDTSPGVKTVVDQAGTNLYTALDSSSALFPIERGLNQLTVALSSATSDSSIVLSYRRRFLGV